MEGDAAIEPEWAVKQRKVKDFLRDRGLEAFVFSRRASFAWLTDGGESGVDEFKEAGAADLVITAEKAYVLAPNNEMERLLAEPLEGQGYEPVVYSWREDRLAAVRALLGKRRTGSDLPLPGCTELYGAVKELRYALLPGERARLESLGQTAAAVVGEVCKRVRPGDSELQIAGAVKGGLGEAGISAPVVLVAADERLDRFRHPLPTARKVRQRVMVVVCARRGGLTVALTRLACFGPVPAETAERLELVNRINARLIAATVPGRTVGKIFAEAVKAYAAAGYPGEWENHHQGGAIGYENRDYIARPGCPAVVQENQSFAWNPMLVNVKSEETIIVTAAGIKPVTAGHGWPCKVYQEGDMTVSLAQIWNP